MAFGAKNTLFLNGEMINGDAPKVLNDETQASTDRHCVAGDRAKPCRALRWSVECRAKRSRYPLSNDSK